MVHDDASGSLPFSVNGSGVILGGDLEIDASSSSQFVSGLLLAAPRFVHGLTLTHVGEHLPSMPHIEMTLDCLRKRGVDAKQIGEAQWRVEPGVINGGEITIEPDLSNSGPFLAAAMVAG
jgi:3-phosphoshikimate 1-carboxyvinyltransferase